MTAFAPLRVPWLAERWLFRSDAVVAVDKPPWLPVHGGDRRLPDDVVGRLGAALDGRPLGVHQRLDLGTSGVLVFSLGPAAARVLAEAFEAHQLTRRYVAVVEGRPLPDRGDWSHRLEHRAGRTAIVRSGGKPAETSFQVLARCGRRALVELLPRTGRTHQLRVQLAQAGAPVLGDRLYGGGPAPRLLLHAASLELGAAGRALGVPPLEAPIPAEFPRHLEGHPGLPPAGELSASLLLAGWRRRPLFEHHEVLRWVNGEGDGLPGVVVDRYGDDAVLDLGSDEALALEPALAAALGALGARCVVAKRRRRGDSRRRVQGAAESSVVVGALPAASTVVREGGLSFEVWLDDGLSTGLFIDQRENRERVRGWAAGGEVLNLFAYTGSFSVAAAAGGAARVTSVDLAARALGRARRNFELNQLAPAAHRCVEEDALRWLERAARRGERFDLVVVDPPSFATVGRGTFSIARDYRRLAGLCWSVLRPGGRLLAVTNHRGTSPAELRGMLLAAAADAGVPVDGLTLLPAARDCPDAIAGPSPSKSATGVVAVTPAGVRARASRG